MSGIFHASRIVRSRTRAITLTRRDYSGSKFFQGARSFILGFNQPDETPTSEFIPYMQYPLMTKDQLNKITTDKFKFEFGHASFGYHSSSTVPSINSLSDLTDPTQLNTLLPRRRPKGSPADTLSIKAGDDTMLVSSTVLAVADGVSGWESDGIQTSSGIWSRSMVETFSRLMTEYKIQHSPHALHKRDIDQILDDSFLHTSHLMDLQKLNGSSTLVLVMLSGDLLQMISIGDSKLYIIRDGEIIKTNEVQMISDLCPQQIGTQTLSLLPSEIAWVESFQLKEDDLIVMCSDGISDNLYESEILNYINEFIYEKKNSLKTAANKLLIKAKEVAFDDYAYTPYNEQVNALPETLKRGHQSMGGKLDDMSVLIAKVVNNPKKM